MAFGNLANTPVKTDSNGYVQVTIGGGTVTAMTITTLTTTKIQPVADSTTAILIANAAGTGIAVFDTSNQRFGLGAATAPGNLINAISNAGNAADGALITNTVSGTAAETYLRLTSGTTIVNLWSNSQGYTTSTRFIASHGLLDAPYLDLSSSGANPIDFWSNNAKAFSIASSGKVGMIAATACAGMGVPSIYAASTVAAQTTQAASIATYTTPNATGDYTVSGNVNVTASSNHSFSLNCTYTDEGGTARTLVMPVAQLAGAFAASGLITNVTGAGPYESAAMHIRCKATTAITILTSAGTFTSVTYNAAGVIRQLQ